MGDIVQKGMVMRLAVLAAVLACGAALSLGAARADDDDDQEAPKSYPYLSGEIESQFQLDNTFSADDDENERANAFNKTEAEINWNFSPRFSIFGHFTFEDVGEPEPGEDRFFEDHGLYAEELYAKFNSGPFALKAGKMNISFGRAPELTPDFYMNDLAEEGYEQVEKLGFSAAFTKNAGSLGDLTFTGSLYKADASALSNSIFSNRGQLDVDDGGFSNTEGLESFAFTVDGDKIPSLPGISYQIGYLHNAKGRIGDLEEDAFAKLDDQNGFVFGLYGERSYGRTKFEWQTEAVYFDNYILEDEEALENVWFLTAAGRLTFNEKWRAGLAYTYQPADLVEGGDFEAHQFALTAGYLFREDLSLDVGYKYFVEDDEDNHTIGLVLTKTLEFDASSKSEPLK